MCSRERKFVFQIAIVLSCILCMLVATSRRGIATARSKIFQKGLRTPTKLCMSSSNKDMNNEGPSTLKVTSAAAVSFNRESAISGLCDFDCNILHKDLAKDTVRLLTAAKSVGVTYSIAPGTDLQSSKEILDLSTSENEMQVFGSAGVHPYNAVTEAYCDDAISQLAVLLTHPNCLAVGECGLDYSSGFPDKAQQMPWFRSQVSLAIQHSKPLYLHSRDAEEDFMAVLLEHGFGNGLKPAVPCCVHCFTGSTEELQRYLDCGFYIGLTGHIMTLDDEKLLTWLNMITLERLVLETDAPYMGFKGCRSKEEKEKKRTYPNVPSSLPKILDRVCEVSGWEPAAVTIQTSVNSLNGFLRLGLPVA